MKYGVPQGSILGPIIFILYTQDLESIALKHGFKIHMYADDTQLYITFKAEQSYVTVPLLEECLKNIKEWMQVNFLKLNEDKTQLLVIPSKKTLNVVDLNVQFNGNELESLADAKNLGVYFDNNLNMNKQIKHLCSTGYSNLRNLWVIGGMLSKELKTQLVHSFILSHIDYCNICLYGINKSEIHQLQKLKTRGVLGKQIIYLKSAKVGDSSGILFTFINIKIKKSKIFFFLYFFPILMIFKNSLIKIFCF